VVDAAGAARAAAAAVDLVAVVFVIGHPIDAVQGAVVVLHGVVVVVPELLEAFLFGRDALVALGEDVPAGLIAAIAHLATPACTGLCAAQRYADDGAEHQGGDPFH